MWRTSLSLFTNLHFTIIESYLVGMSPSRPPAHLLPPLQTEAEPAGPSPQRLLKKCSFCPLTPTSQWEQFSFQVSLGPKANSSLFLLCPHRPCVIVIVVLCHLLWGGLRSFESISGTKPFIRVAFLPSTVDLECQVLWVYLWVLDLSSPYQLYSLRPQVPHFFKPGSSIKQECSSHSTIGHVPESPPLREGYSSKI